MTAEQRAEVKDLIVFYERRGRDWSDAAEFLIRKHNGTLPATCYLALSRPVPMSDGKASDARALESAPPERR